MCWLDEVAWDLAEVTRSSANSCKHSPFCQLLQKARSATQTCPLPCSPRLFRRQLFPTFLWSTSPFKDTFQCFPSLFQHGKGLLWGSNIIISQCDIVCSALG